MVRVPKEKLSASKVQLDAHVATLVKVAQALRDARGAGADRAWLARALTEAIKYHWEIPNASGFRIGTQFWSGWLWSPDARGLYEENGGSGLSGMLVKEHVMPKNLYASEFLESQMSVADAASWLNEHSVIAVVAKVRYRSSKSDDELLRPFKSRLPHEGDDWWKGEVAAGRQRDLDDPWNRYRAVGLDPDRFQPLHQSAEWAAVGRRK